MAENNYIKEYLSTGAGTEGTLLIPRKIYATMIEEVMKVLIPRSEAALYIGPSEIPGSSVDINLESVNTLKLREVGEGTELPMDNQEYATTNLKPVKYGVQIKITRELLEDAQWNILERNVRIAGRRVAENENSLVVSNGLDSATNTVAGGAGMTIANITRAMQYLEDADYTPSTFIAGNQVLNNLRNIDTFVEFAKVGNTDMISKGFLGNIYGMNVLRVSTNAGMTTTTAYVLDNRHGYVIAEKRPMTVENFELPQFDMSATSITQRITVKVLRSDAICKITSS